MTPEQIRRFNSKYRSVQADDFTTKKKGNVQWKHRTVTKRTVRNTQSR